MKISSVKVNHKKKPFYTNGKISLFANSDGSGKFTSFTVKQNGTVKEFKVKYSKTKVDILSAWKDMEDYLSTILKK